MPPGKPLPVLQLQTYTPISDLMDIKSFLNTVEGIIQNIGIKIDWPFLMLAI